MRIQPASSTRVTPRDHTFQKYSGVGGGEWLGGRGRVITTFERLIKLPQTFNIEKKILDTTSAHVLTTDALKK